MQITEIFGMSKSREKQYKKFYNSILIVKNIELVLK